MITLTLSVHPFFLPRSNLKGIWKKQRYFDKGFKRGSGVVAGTGCRRVSIFDHHTFKGNLAGRTEVWRKLDLTDKHYVLS
jgi:hypothetical protein